MRTIHAVRRRVEMAATAEYLATLEEMRETLRGSSWLGSVKGFYVMEAAEEPGTFWELMEFTDRTAATSFGVQARQLPAWEQLEKRLRSLPTGVLDDSLWDQRV